MSYQGWENYETWRVHHWLTSDEITYKHWAQRKDTISRQVSTGEIHKGYLNAEEAVINILADEIKDALYEQFDDILPEAGLVSEIAKHALTQVDFEAVASHFIEE